MLGILNMRSLQTVKKQYMGNCPRSIAGECILVLFYGGKPYTTLRGLYEKIN